MEEYGAVCKKLKRELPYDATISLLNVYSEKIIQKETHTPMFIAAQFTVTMEAT